MTRAKMTAKMIDFYHGDVAKIEHFLKVLAYASLIGRSEKIDSDTQELLEMCAIVHDISIPLCMEKYGDAEGVHQHAESEALLRPFLAEYSLAPEVLERIVFVISHHHDFNSIDGMDYQILVEADYLVNASEQSFSETAIRNFRDKIAKTETGKKLLTSVFSL